MTFSFERTWADMVALLRERWIGLSLIIVGIHAVSALASLPFLAVWSDAFYLTADPQMQAARMAQAMPRAMGVAFLSFLIQIAGFAAAVALLGPGRPSLDKALLEGIKATPTLLVAIVFLAVGLYLAMLVPMLLVMVALSPFIGAAAGTGEVSPAAALSMLVAMLAVYFAMLAAMLYLGTRFVTLLPVAVVERERNPFTLIARSWKLTRGNGWKLVALFLLLWVPLGMLTIVLMLAAAPSPISLDGTPPTPMDFLPVWLAMIPLNIVMAMLLTTIIVSLHGQLVETEPESSDEPS